MILIAVISLGAIGAVGAVFLYAASKKFEVYEDPRIAQVQEVLPGANCGGCGYPGCAGFAGACVKADSLDDCSAPLVVARSWPRSLQYWVKRRVQPNPW